MQDTDSNTVKGLRLIMVIAGNTHKFAFPFSMLFLVGLHMTF